MITAGLQCNAFLPPRDVVLDKFQETEAIPYKQGNKDELQKLLITSHPRCPSLFLLSEGQTACTAWILSKDPGALFGVVGLLGV